MTDFCFPKGNEEEFVEIALGLGIRNLCFIYTDEKEAREADGNGIKIYKAFSVNKNTIQKFRNKFTVMKSALRQDIELKPSMVISNERMALRDSLHYRHSGLDQVMCRIMHENNTFYGINFNDVLNANSNERSVLIGRMMQNIEFCRKYKVKVVVGSFALKPYELRSLHDLEAFGITLGMHPSEIRNKEVLGCLH